MVVDYSQKYKQLCAENGWTVDPDQLKALQVFTRMKPKKSGFWSRFQKADDGVSGVYLYGGVGRGKSFVMDMFYQHTDITPKRRIHFHEFMQDIHQRLHEKRGMGASQNTGAHLTDIADEISDKYKLICFDEMFVDDVADAMLLGRLFTALINANVLLVMTSNIRPQDLYKDGLQRERFIPFIELIENTMRVLHFAGAQDYRAGRMKDHKRYLNPLSPENQAEFEAIFKDAANDRPVKKDELSVAGRSLMFPKTAGDVLKVDFENVCGASLGAGDYLAIARRYSTVMIGNIPQMDDTRPDAVKRFITLIDTLYEKKRLVFILADGAIENLYTGKRHTKAFVRTESRLMEMSAPQYP